MDKLLSIIIPVYKVEKYINKCLDSVIISDDNMKLIEVVVVNDGTPDNSALMAKEYEKRYPNTIKVYDKENGGHGSAWNKGVELATGKYIRFLDSDDWLTNLEEFVNSLKTCDADMVFTNLNIYYQDIDQQKIYIFKNVDPGIEYNVSDFDWKKTKYIFRGYNITNFHMCTYKSSLLKKYHPLFIEKIFYDDEILFVMPLCVSNTFVFYDLILYNYLLGRPGQTLDPKVLKRNIDFKMNVREAQIDFYANNKPKSIIVCEEIERIIKSRVNDTFYLLSQLPYKDSKKKVTNWDGIVQRSFPEYKKTKLYRIYKKSFLLYWLYYGHYTPFKIKVNKYLYR